MLFRKVIRDLKQNAVQFIAIFITTFLAMFVLAGFNASERGAYVTGDRYLKDTNFLDLSVSGGIFTPQDIDRLALTDGVKSVSGISHAAGKITLDEELPLVISFIDGNEVSSMLVTEGEPYRRGDRGVWVEDIFARRRGLRCGDTITFTSGNNTFHEEIRGFVYSPEYIYYVPNDSFPEPEYGNHGFMIMDITEAPAGNRYYDRLIIDLENVNGQILSLTNKEVREMERMREVIAERLDDPHLMVDIKTDDEGYDGFANASESTGALSVIFPALFLAVTLLGLLSTMTRLASAQRTQIGTLKALGFSTATIMFHYLSYSTVITALACVCGIFIGKNTLGVYLNDIQDYYYQNPYIDEILSVKCLIASLLIVGLCILTTYMCTKGIVTQNAADILKPEPPRIGRGIFLEKTAIWKKLKFATRWNVRDVAINRLRTIMSILGIMLCSALLFVAVSFYQALADVPDWQYDELTRLRYEIIFKDDASYGTVYDYAREFNGQMVQEGDVHLYSADEELLRPLTVVDKGDCFYLQDEELEYFDIPDSGAVLAMRFGDEYGIAVGDTVSFRIPGDERTYRVRIVGINRHAHTQGLIMSREALEAIGGTFSPTQLYTNITIPDDIKNRPGVDVINTVDTLKASLEASNAIGYTATFIIIVMAVITGVTILYNLGVLSYLEKVREIATLKVLGFSSPDIRFILMQQNLSVTFIGALLGVPMGVIVLDLLIVVFMGIDGDAREKITFLAVLSAVAGTFAVSLLVNMFVTGKVKTVDMVEALKGVE